MPPIPEGVEARKIRGGKPDGGSMPGHLKF